jgi:hypothetical protein
VTNIRTFVNPDSPTQLAVLMDVPDMDALKGAMQSDAAAEAMAHDGVVPESLVILVEEQPRVSAPQLEVSRDVPFRALRRGPGAGIRRQRSGRHVLFDGSEHG